MCSYAWLMCCLWIGLAISVKLHNALMRLEAKCSLISNTWRKLPSTCSQLAFVCLGIPGFNKFLSTAQFGHWMSVVPLERHPHRVDAVGCGQCKSHIATLYSNIVIFHVAEDGRR